MFRNALEKNAPATSRPQATLGRRVLGLAALLSIALGIAAGVDQQGGGSLRDHATAMYAAHGVDVDPNLPYVVLYLVAGVLAVGWVAAVLAARARTSIALATVVTVTVVNLAAALVLLVVTEYGERVFPPLWGLLTALPVVAGAVALATLVRRGTGGRTVTA